jgi:hypothetical protein
LLALVKPTVWFLACAGQKISTKSESKHSCHSDPKKKVLIARAFHDCMGRLGGAVEMARPNAIATVCVSVTAAYLNKRYGCTSTMR